MSGAFLGTPSAHLIAISGILMSPRFSEDKPPARFIEAVSTDGPRRYDLRILNFQQPLDLKGFRPRPQNGVIAQNAYFTDFETRPDDVLASWILSGLPPI